MEELKEKHQKELQEVQKRQRAEIQALKDRLTLAQQFHEQLIANQWRLKRLMKHGNLCYICHRNDTPANYTQKYILDGNIYCDAHGKIKSEHSTTHPEKVKDCQDCALLDCPYLCDSHNITDPSDCHECRLWL